MKQVDRVKGAEGGGYSAGATSPAFLSPRLWDEDGPFLPPSTEVPHRPMLGSKREQSDRACFGFYVFVMVLFIVQGVSAVLSANYQLPHEFQLCENRLQQESVQVARNIPQAEINQHNLANAEEHVGKGHSKLFDVHGHLMPTATHSSSKHAGSHKTEKVKSITTAQSFEGGRRLLADDDKAASTEVTRVLQALLDDLKQRAWHGSTRQQLSNATNEDKPEKASAAGKAQASKQEEKEKEKKEKKKTKEVEGDEGGEDLPNEEEHTLQMLFRRLRSASGIVALLAASSIVIGLVWVLLLAHFTEPLVYVTLASLPLAFLSGAGLLMLQGGAQLWVVAALLACSVLSVGVFLFVRASLPLTMSLLRCASQALLENSSVFVITVCLSVIQVLWLGCCGLFVVLEFMSGVAVRLYPPPRPDGTVVPPRCVWQTDGWAYVGMVFVVAIMLWTNAIMEEIKRFAIAGGITLWYSSDPKGSFRIAAPRYPSLMALQWAVSSSFGSLCFSAVALNLCETLKMVLRLCRRACGGGEEARADETEEETEDRIEEGLWTVEEVIWFVNRFATPMMAHSGYPLCHSCKVSALLIRRNNLLCIVEDRSPALILRLGALVVATWSGVAGWVLSDAYVEWAVVDKNELHVIHRLVARFVLAASFSISLLVLNFLASMLLDGMDALLLLYALDRDNRAMQPRGTTLHELLAAQQVGKAQPGLSNYTPRGWNFVRSSLSARGRPRSSGSSKPTVSVVGGVLPGTLSHPPSPVKEEVEPLAAT